MANIRKTLDSVKLSRRTILAGGSAVFVAGVSTQAFAQDAKDEKLKPGDRIVFAEGEHKGKPIPLDQLVVGNAPVAALPADPASGTMRDGSRFNKLLLLRMKPEDLDEETKPRSVDGIIAYSAICTHQGCTLNAWNAEAKVIQCFCHHSQFSTGTAGKPVQGPATANLPMLPIGLADGALIAAADFTSKPGPKK